MSDYFSKSLLSKAYFIMLRFTRTVVNFWIAIIYCIMSVVVISSNIAIITVNSDLIVN